jgi:hypothetical protein
MRGVEAESDIGGPTHREEVKTAEGISTRNVKLT